MSALPTYKQQFDKITEAYIKGEIEPWSNNFCFCGTLSPDNKWRNQPAETQYPYRISQYIRMENALLFTLSEETTKSLAAYKEAGCMNGFMFDDMKEHSNYEDALFNGMCAALEVLKQIHIERGEVIQEDVPMFKKRELIIQ